MRKLESFPPEELFDDSHQSGEDPRSCSETEWHPLEHVHPSFYPKGEKPSEEHGDQYG